MRNLRGDIDIEHIVTSELQLLDPAVRRCRAACSALLDDEFHEVGASGRIWDRASILDEMATAEGPAPVVENLAAVRFVPDAVLVTYRSRVPGRTSLRSSVWRRGTSRWTLYFHQGTPLPDEGQPD